MSDKPESTGMKWIMLPEGHDWLKHPEIGAIASIDDDGSTQWQSPDGHHWKGAKSTVETWLEYGFVECTKEQAEASIRAARPWFDCQRRASALSGYTKED